MNIIDKIFAKISCVYMKRKQRAILSKLGYCGRNAIIEETEIYNPQNIYLYDDANILEGFVFINHKGRFFFHKGSSAARNLTVVTDSHIRAVGKFFKDKELFYQFKDNITADVIVEDEVWIGTNVTLLPGAKISRGATVGAGSVIRGIIPPYSIVMGNPAKVTGFCSTPGEIIEHEKVLYSEEERLPIELLEKNYKKFFLNRLKEIKEFTKL